MTGKDRQTDFEKQFSKLIELAGGSQALLAECAGVSGQSTVAMWLKNGAISRAGIKALKRHKNFKNRRINWVLLAGL